MSQRAKMSLGIILMICGIVLFAFSNYITVQVAVGRGEISSGQAKVNGINGLIDNTTRVNGLGNLFTGSAQDKINSGTQKANYYARLAARLKMAGIGLVILGAIGVFFGFKKGKMFRR